MGSAASLNILRGGYELVVCDLDNLSDEPISSYFKNAVISKTRFYPRPNNRHVWSWFCLSY